MAKTQTTKKPGLFTRLFGFDALRAEKARLQAFLNAVPLAWCGLAPDGALAYRPEFLKLLNITSMKSIDDLQHALMPSDGAVLESLFTRLNETGEGFSVLVQLADRSKTLRLTGSRGVDPDTATHFDILWLADESSAMKSRHDIEKNRDMAEEERDRLQSALDQVPFPLWMRNAHTDIVWCNRAYAQALESSPATVIAEQKELPLKAARKGSVKVPGKGLAQSAFDSGQIEQSTAHIVMGGSRHLMIIAEIPLPASNMSLGFARDITREEELESEQRRYMAANKELLEQLGTAIGIFSSDQKLEFFNSAFSQLWGLEDQFLNGRPKLGDIMEKLREGRRLPEQADFRKYKQTWLNMFTGLLGPHEDMLYLPNGAALRMLVVPHPMGGLMMTFEDVTSRLELESSYNTLIAVQKETLDNLAEGVAVFGSDGRLKLCNPSFAGLWRLNPEDLEGQPHITRLADKMKTRFKPEDWPKWQKTLVIKSIDRTTQEGRLECADGTLISYSTVPLPDGGVLVTHVDVTDTVQVENALREKNAALEAAEQLKLDFLANVSYQLRTPLNAISGFNEILSNKYFGPLNDKQSEYTAGIHEAGGRLMGLIDDILDLSTIEAGYMELNRNNVDASDILHNIQELTQGWARKEKVEIRLDLPANLGQIPVDAQRLKQALLNLVRNAIAHSPEGGTIVLAAKRTADTMLLSVKDSGPGISDEDRDRIFQPFERAATPHRQNAARGAGLGLTLVRNIVEMHGGRVLLESIHGKGSTFTLALPLTIPARVSSRKTAS